MKIWYLYGLKHQSYPGYGFIKCIPHDDYRGVRIACQYKEILAYDRQLHHNELEEHDIDYLGELKIGE